MIDIILSVACMLIFIIIGAIFSAMLIPPPHISEAELDEIAEKQMRESGMSEEEINYLLYGERK